MAMPPETPMPCRRKLIAPRPVAPRNTNRRTCASGLLAEAIGNELDHRAHCSSFVGTAGFEPDSASHRCCQHHYGDHAARAGPAALEDHRDAAAELRCQSNNLLRGARMQSEGVGE